MRFVRAFAVLFLVAGSCPWAGVAFADVNLLRNPEFAGDGLGGCLNWAVRDGGKDVVTLLKGEGPGGADGYGTCAVVGSVGSFTLQGDLVLTNVASVATSGSCLSFRADVNGIKPIVSTGALTIRDNAKLMVDLSAYEGPRSKLKILSCASHTGDFASVSVVWKPTDKNTGIEWIGNDLYAVRPGKGLVATLR